MVWGEHSFNISAGIHDVVNIWRKRMTDWLTDSLNHEAVCRSAPATPGLINTELCILNTAHCIILTELCTLPLQFRAAFMVRDKQNVINNTKSNWKNTFYILKHNTICMIGLELWQFCLIRPICLVVDLHQFCNQFWNLALWLSLIVNMLSISVTAGIDCDWQWQTKLHWGFVRQIQQEKEQEK